MLPAAAFALFASIDPALATRYLAEAAGWCEAEGRRLWGKSLCGPIVLVEASTREYLTSDKQTGTLPADMLLANTSTEWNGRKWTMLLWPVPENGARRKALFAHELWHGIQGDLGFPSTGPANAHLDEVEGRIWLRLEARALRLALESAAVSDSAAAIADALAFRKRRYSIFKDAAVQEQQLEMHEGLAEYTGCALSGEGNRLGIDGLDKLDRATSGYARSFAYATGPAYGLLLDKHAGQDWRKSLKASDTLVSLLAAALPKPAGRDPFTTAVNYDGGAVRQQELGRERERFARLDRYRKLFIEGPVVSVPAAKQLNFSFDPNKQFALEPVGTVYEGMQVTDLWGTLRVSGSALISKDFQRVVVPKPDPTGLAGEGWSLTLAEGWAVAPGKRTGDWVVQRIVP